VAEGLAANADTLLQLLGAGGAVVRLGGVARLYGETPPASVVESLLTSLHDKYGSVIKGVDNAGQPGGIAAEHAATASGMLMIPLANNPNDIIVWFRPQIHRTVRWGGDPTKALTPDAEGRISPRKSFAAWSQQVEGCAEPWSDADFRTANDVRRMITLALLRKAEKQLSLLTNFDPLTGLINRRAGEAAIDRWESDPQRGPAACLHLDVDRFKAINDTLGPRVGDAILIEVASRLRGLAPSGSVVGRISSDEFGLFWPDAGEAEALQLSQTVLQAMLVPFVIGEQAHYVSVSIGMAYAEAGAAQDLLRQSDAALIVARRGGGGKLVEYEEGLHASVLAEMELDQELHQAVIERDFEVHYQPVVRAQGAGVVGFEALVRWRQPSRGWISPGLFIPCAEETGLIGRIGGHVMRLAVRQLAVWRAEHGDLTMAINISGRQLQDSTLAGSLSALLAETGVPAHAICLEVTEGVLLQGGAVRELQQLRALGVEIAVDDFGTGYCSLAYLRTLPVTIVKIDRSFVTPIGTDAKADRLFQAIVDLAHTLDLGTIAEGVETTGQWESMAASGCELVQGWYIARAMEPAAASQFLRRAH
jgi:diguanylate cyclase (GGDEF)-like protein